VYAALAATIAAGLEGIEQQMPAPSICEEDLYEKFASQQVMPERLPNNLLTAIEALAKDSKLKTRLGEAFCEQLIEIKRQEWDEYAEHISNWELQTYCDKF
jgi:glutamine synthetase